jgi:hypothetical protein
MMRGTDETSGSLFSHVDLEEAHPLQTSSAQDPAGGERSPHDPRCSLLGL